MKALSSKEARPESTAGNPPAWLSRLLRLPAPDVILDVVFEDGLLYLEVVNIGTACASRVRIDLSPSVIGAVGRDVRQQALFSNLEFLPPGKRIRTFVDGAAAYFDRKAARRVSAVVTWADDGGRPYRRAICHDLSIYEDIVEATLRRST